MKRYSTILFDLDGMLIDSAPSILACVRYALDVMGFEEPEGIMRFLGPPLYESFGSFCGMTKEQAVEAVRLYRDRYSAGGMLEVSAFGGIEEMLERLRAEGFRMAVATSKPREYAEKILAHIGLDGYFEVIGGAELDGTRNEKYEVIGYVLERMGIGDCAEVLMAGDRKHDIIGAHKLGIDCMAVLWGYGSAEEFKEHGADIIAKTPQEAADIIIRQKTLHK